MSGEGMSQPVVRARIAILDEMGEDEVFRLYLEHRSVAKLCAALFQETEHHRPGPDAFYKWLRAEPDRWGRWQDVLAMRGDMHAEEAVEAVEKATKENVQVQRLKFDGHKWAAGVFNRDYRPGQSAVNVNVAVGVGAGWLEALEALSKEALREIPTTKAEVVEDDAD